MSVWTQLKYRVTPCPAGYNNSKLTCTSSCTSFTVIKFNLKTITDRRNPLAYYLSIQRQKYVKRQNYKININCGYPLNMWNFSPTLPLLKQFFSLTWLCWELLLVCPQIFSVSREESAQILLFSSCFDQVLHILFPNILL